MNLTGLKVAILVADGFEQSEMVEPRKALQFLGAVVDIVSPEKDTVRSWKDKNWSEKFPVNVALALAKADDYHALLLPGGVMNPDTLRINHAAVAFVKKIIEARKPIAAICHGPWTLINAEGVKGKKMTSWPSLELDLTNAGAHWVDQEVVRDVNLVTSRKPDDIPAFNKAMIELFGATLQKK